MKLPITLPVVPGAVPTPSSWYTLPGSATILGVTVLNRTQLTVTVNLSASALTSSPNQSYSVTPGELITMETSAKAVSFSFSGVNPPLVAGSVSVVLSSDAVTPNSSTVDLSGTIVSAQDSPQPVSIPIGGATIEILPSSTSTFWIQDTDFYIGQGLYVASFFASGVPNDGQIGMAFVGSNAHGSVHIQPLNWIGNLSFFPAQPFKLLTFEGADNPGLPCQLQLIIQGNSEVFKLSYAIDAFFK